MVDLASWEQKMSLSYVKNDRRVRKRIVDDDVEFQDDIWGSLQDGTGRATLTNSSEPPDEPFDVPLMTDCGVSTVLHLLAQTLCLGLLAFYPDERWTIQDAFHSQWIQSDLKQLSSVYLQRVGAEDGNQLS